jgi:hypothetical protein
MAKKKRWIQKAVPKARKGVFKAKAEAAGKTTREYAAEHAGDKGTLGKEARLAETLMGMHHGKKKTAKLYTHPSSNRG